MPLISYISVFVVDAHIGNQYVRVAIDHPWSKLPYVTIDDVLTSEFRAQIDFA
jgi:hypothetical protein